MFKFGDAILLRAEPGRIELDNDCACPDTPSTLAPRPLSDRLYHRARELYSIPLPYGFTLATSPHAPHGPSVLNAAAWSRLESFVSPHHPDEPLDELLGAQALIEPVIPTEEVSAGKPEMLTVWLHISNACNLDCPYCYVRKSSERMTKEIGEQALQNVFMRAHAGGFRRIKLKYAGGEATLHWDLVEHLHAFATHCADSTGLELRHVLLSNGTRLGTRQADWLAANGVKLMISLDGVGAMHDRLRSRKDGAPTFTHIEQAIDGLLRPRGIRPDITVTITQLNAEGVPEVVRWALERNLPVNLNFYRRNALTATRQELELEEQTIIRAMRASYQVVEEFLPTYPFFNGLLDRVKGEAHTHTCGVGLAYLVITHKGELAECQMHVNQPPLLLVGAPFDAKHRAAIQNLAVDLKEGCRACQFRYQCTGGCPLETYRATGRWDISSPNCTIYKTLIPEALRLEGLRLLKVSGFWQN